VETIRHILDWFAGGDMPYRTLFHCMRGDTFWIVVTVGLDLAVTTGYLAIALHWWNNERNVPESPAKTALGMMKKIFLFCGIVGYLFIPVKMFWPAWRLYDMFMLVLAFYTWRYALSSRHLSVVYKALEQTEQLAGELRESRADAERKGYFLNAISHDLRTPLNGLMLQTDLAGVYLRGDDREGLEEALAEIKAGARATAELLSRFLELGRLDWSSEPNRNVTFPLGEMLQACARSYQAHADLKGLRLVVDTREAPLVHLDRVKLERIVLNLLDNALKFTAGGTVRLHAARRGPEVVVTVEDTGEGVPAALHDRLFEDFFQVNNSERDSSKGFGLGLAIVRRLARQLGADVRLTSAVGVGTRVELALRHVGLDPVPDGTGDGDPDAGRVARDEPQRPERAASAPG
jgi:signal transduction histidine kinase